MNNFWQQLKRPFFCLAPMEEVTDAAFREMFARYGKPDVLFTEFVNVDGLMHPEGRKKLAADLKYTEKQRPVVAQLWGTSPLLFEQAAKVIAEMGFDGIDINMGCPQDREISLGACAALIRRPELAAEIIKSTKRGAGDLPVSVKTRIGYSKNTLDHWLKVLLAEQPAVITVHGRTKMEKSKVPADWQAITQAVKIRNELKSKTLIVGNGDVKSYAEGLMRAKQSGADGVMVGRGAFGNPWFFRGDNYQPQIKERLEAMLEHARLFAEWLPEKSFYIMRKHFKAYASGFSGAHELRARLMEVKSLEETEKIVSDYLKKNK